MNTHPVAPLTDDNEPHYRRLHEAKQKLETTVDVKERIELKAIIGKESSEILRLKRKEKKPVGTVTLMETEKIIKEAEICESVAQVVAKPYIAKLIELARKQAETIAEQQEHLALLRKPQPIVDVPATVEAWQEAAKEVQL